MSTWRRVTQVLYALGGSATSKEVGNALGGLYAVDAYTRGKALNNVSRLGVVQSSGGKWHLTHLGTAWCEGRVMQVRTRPGGVRWVSTWLASLPRDVRISAGGSARDRVTGP